MEQILEMAKKAKVMNLKIQVVTNQEQQQMKMELVQMIGIHLLKRMTLGQTIKDIY
jgi:hypothetical protein